MSFRGYEDLPTLLIRAQSRRLSKFSSVKTTFLDQDWINSFFHSRITYSIWAKSYSDLSPFRPRNAVLLTLLPLLNLTRFCYIFYNHFELFVLHRTKKASYLLPGVRSGRTVWQSSQLNKITLYYSSFDLLICSFHFLTTESHDPTYFPSAKSRVKITVS